jgi:hypothetical protein
MPLVVNPIYRVLVLYRARSVNRLIRAHNPIHGGRPLGAHRSPFLHKIETLAFTELLNHQNKIL